MSTDRRLRKQKLSKSSLFAFLLDVTLLYRLAMGMMSMQTKTSHGKPEAEACHAAGFCACKQSNGRKSGGPTALSPRPMTLMMRSLRLQTKKRMPEADDAWESQSRPLSPQTVTFCNDVLATFGRF